MELELKFKPLTFPKVAPLHRALDFRHESDFEVCRDLLRQDGKVRARARARKARASRARARNDHHFEEQGSLGQGTIWARNEQHFEGIHAEKKVAGRIKRLKVRERDLYILPREELLNEP